MNPRHIRVAALAVAMALVAGAAAVPLATVAAVQADDDLRLDGLVLDFTLRPVVRLKGTEGPTAERATRFLVPPCLPHLGAVAFSPAPATRRPVPVVLRI